MTTFQNYIHAAFPKNIQQNSISNTHSVKNAVIGFLNPEKIRVKKGLDLKNQHDATIFVAAAFLASIPFSMVFPPLGSLLWLVASIGAFYCVFRKDSNRFDRIVGLSIIGINTLLVILTLALFAILFA